MEIAAALLAAAMVLGATSALGGNILANQRRIERKLDRLLEHAGLALAPPVSDTVLQMARTAGKVAAIKPYRKETGADLAEAKAAIEAALARRQ
jgi:ribosomal protein L7/L12